MGLSKGRNPANSIELRCHDGTQSLASAAAIEKNILGGRAFAERAVRAVRLLDSSWTRESRLESWTLYSTVQYSTVYSKVQCTVQYWTVLYYSVQ